MKFVLFYHSLISDWNHGNAHFLRGIASELLARRHQVDIYEPADGWSLRQLVREQGQKALENFHAAFPELQSTLYSLNRLDLEQVLEGADVVIVHEWNDPDLVRRVGEVMARLPGRLFLHDTHHRCVSQQNAVEAFDLQHYDGVLAFGRAIADRYLHEGWTRLAWVWHEAADVRRFHPPVNPERGRGTALDLVWVGNWGDDERAAELIEFLVEPVARLQLRARVHGVRYPEKALHELQQAGIDYGGWIPNYRVPELFARSRCTVHVPRRAYASELPGIPTIRMFEALACGIPLVSAPWEDSEHLFRPGVDYLVAHDGEEMARCLREVLSDAELASSLAECGLRTVLGRHTCAHRVDELLRIVAGLQTANAAVRRSGAG
jgi:spore maturation protein CgeB